jgi:diaminopimelate decarboxylase
MQAMNNLIRPTLYEAYHKVEPILKKNRSMIVTDIVGPICETW